MFMESTVMAKTTRKKAESATSSEPPKATRPRSAAPATAVAKAATRAAAGPTPEQIRARAFEIYLRRNGGPGDAHADWTQAERELRSEMKG
jgi:hypothetical protein